MKGLGRRTWFLLGLGALSVPLVAAAVAYGCTAAATLSPDPTAAAPGSVVKVTGKYFATHEANPASAGPVSIRLGSVTGPVLAEGKPEGTDRSFTVSMRVPDGTAPGDTFISATQLNASGTPVSGTPARQAFEVLSPAAAGSPGSGSAPGAGQPGNRAAPRQLATLSLAKARRLAASRVKRSNRGAKAIRSKCARRNRTSAVCRVTYRVRSKTVTKKVVVRSQTSSARW